MKVKKRLPDQAYLRECFHYDQDTGELTWQCRPRHHFRSDRIWDGWNTRFAGAKAGTPHTDGRLTVKLDKKRWVVTRLIWRIVTGKEPDEIDHRNCKNDDNRWLNLRDCSARRNSYNKPGRSAKMLPKGVKLRSNGRYQAQIANENGGKISLGTFDTPEAAHAAYREAATRLHGEFANFGHS